MPEPKKTVTEIMLSGNARKLSRNELVARAKDESAERDNRPSTSRPRMPKHLSAQAAIIWRLTARLMKQRGTLSADCAPTLEVYSEVSARWIAAKQDIIDRGIIVKQLRHDKQGSEYTVEVPNECLSICQDCERQLLSLSKALGLTPDTRERVKRTKAAEAAEAKPGTVAAMFPELFRGKK